MFQGVRNPREIWAAIEREYTTQKQGTDKFLIKKYFEFKLVDSFSLMDQIHNLQVIVSKLKDYGVEVSESFQVGAIIAKLPPLWNDYQKKLLHTSETLTLSSVLKHLRIEEGARILQKLEVDDAPKTNMVEEKMNSGSKRKRPENTNSKNNKKKIEIVTIVVRKAIIRPSANSTRNKRKMLLQVLILLMSVQKL